MCERVCVCVFVLLCSCMCGSVCVRESASVCVFGCVWVCMCGCVCVCERECECVWVCCRIIFYTKSFSIKVRLYLTACLCIEVIHKNWLIKRDLILKGEWINLFSVLSHTQKCIQNSHCEQLILNGQPNLA